MSFNLISVVCYLLSLSFLFLYFGVLRENEAKMLLLLPTMFLERHQGYFDFLTSFTQNSKCQQEVLLAIAFEYINSIRRRLFTSPKINLGCISGKQLSGKGQSVLKLVPIIRSARLAGVMRAREMLLCAFATIRYLKYLSHYVIIIGPDMRVQAKCSNLIV